MRTFLIPHRASTNRCDHGQFTDYSIDHYPHLTRAIMSNISSQSTSCSKFDAIFNAALRSYKKKTGNDITSHPLATELQSCDSSEAVLAILRRQLSTLDQSQNSDEEFANCLIPIVNALYTLSDALGEAVDLVIIIILSLWSFCALTYFPQVFSPSKVIFTGIGALLMVCYPVFRCAAHFDVWCR